MQMCWCIGVHVLMVLAELDSFFCFLFCEFLGSQTLYLSSSLHFLGRGKPIFLILFAN